MKQLFTICLLILSTFGFGNVIDFYAKLSPDKIQCTVSSSRSVAICQGETFFVQGNNQTIAGTYYDTLKSSLNCDSIIITTLIVNPTYYKQDTVTICGYDSLLINGRYIKTEGSYVDSFKTTPGCDSIIVTTAINRGFVAIATVFGPSFLQAANSGHYQWLDCDSNYAAIIGDTSEFFHIPKPGHYAVEVTNNGCIDTSDCIGLATSINDYINNTLKVYPNPAREQVTIDFEDVYSSISIDIITITGQILTSTHFENQKIVTLNTQHLSTGIYMLRVKAADKQTWVQIHIR